MSARSNRAGDQPAFNPKENNTLNEHVALVVTTSHRGVFFGYGTASDAETIRLERARMCVYWPAQNKGVLGLASEGPAKGSRVGPAVPAITLRDVTSVVECSPAAVEAWEKAPWA